MEVIFSWQGPLGLLPSEVKATSKGLLHHVLLQERSSEPRSVCNIPVSCGDTSCVSNWIVGLGGKIRLFLSGGPNAVRTSNCLKIHPISVFLVSSKLALLHPLAFLKQGGSSQVLASGPFAVECHLEEVITVWHPAFLYTLRQPASSWAVLP